MHTPARAVPLMRLVPPARLVVLLTATLALVAVMLGASASTAKAQVTEPRRPPPFTRQRVSVVLRDRGILHPNAKYYRPSGPCTPPRSTALGGGRTSQGRALGRGRGISRAAQLVPTRIRRALAVPCRRVARGEQTAAAPGRRRQPAPLLRWSAANTRSSRTCRRADTLELLDGRREMRPAVLLRRPPRGAAAAEG